MRSGGVRYCPRLLVTTDVETPVATCVTTTGAPGTGAPLSSTTVPTMTALSACCAAAGAGSSASVDSTMAARRTNEDQDDIDHTPEKTSRTRQEAAQKTKSPGMKSLGP